MARKLKANTEIEDNGEDKPKRGKKAATPPSTNTPDEIVLKFQAKAIAADNEFQTAKEAMDSKRGTYRAILKEAAEAGVDKDALVWLVRNRKRDAADIDRETRARNRMARLAGMPLGAQLGMFEDGNSVAGTVDGDALAEDNDAFEEGKTAGAAGRPADSCPYDKNSRGGIRWVQGYDDAQFENRKDLGKGSQTLGAAH